MSRARRVSWAWNSPTARICPATPLPCRAAGARSSTSPAIAAPSRNGMPISSLSCRPRCRRISPSPDRQRAACCFRSACRRRVEGGNRWQGHRGSQVPRRGLRHFAPVVGEGEPRQGLHRLPERCDRQGPAACRARRLPRHRARQALHDDRHGDGPGQTWQRQRHRHPGGGDGALHRAGRHHTFRPFYTPVSFGALAGPFSGHHFQPVRKTPLHDWAEEQGAVFVETGLWMRSSWFPREGEDWLAAASREVIATRNGVGLCDVSTLGKIDVQGKDAAPSSTGSTANLLDTRRGQGALWPDAARGRHRL